MDSQLTVILLNYRRPGNNELIRDVLDSQSIPIEVLTIDNSGWLGDDVSISWNGGCFARLLFSIYAKTPWVMWISDDICPTDDDFAEDAIETASRHINGVTGVYGHRLNLSAPHYVKMENEAEDVSIIKGCLLLFHRSLLARVNLARNMLFSNSEYLKRCDDIYLSLETGYGGRTHWADDGLLGRTKELPKAEVGLCKDYGHYQIREQFCADWLGEVLSGH